MLLDMAAALPVPMPASILLVQHIGAHGSVLPELLRRSGRNPAMHARSGMPIETGYLYVAPPDHHKLVAGDEIRLTRAAKENHTPPAIAQNTVTMPAKMRAMMTTTDRGRSGYPRRDNRAPTTLTTAMATRSTEMPNA